MEVPLDPTTLSPSPFYEPKTEEEKAKAREAGEAVAAAKRAEEKAAFSWAKENCSLEVITEPSQRFEVTRDTAICLVRVEGDCPHGVAVTVDGQALPSATLGDSMTQIFFSKEGSRTITLFPDGEMGQITAIEIWTLSAP